MSNSNGSVNIIASHYKIEKKIGEGSFGIIFKGVDLLRNNQPVAIKFENRRSDAPQLKDEYKAYKILNSSLASFLRNGGNSNPENGYHFLSTDGIPEVHYFGQEGYYNILIIQLLGPSLEDLFDWCGRRFTIKTVAQVAKQMISRLQFVHENDLIYRDIKPDNFLVGNSNESNVIYMVDYGMIKQYRNPLTKQHIPYREKKSLSGTARYMSINTHLGREQSRRDDLESLGHVFFYFLRGSLPWQGLKAANNKLKYEKIGDKKRSTPIDQLCEGFPRQFAEYLSYVRNLKFEETPDYRHLCKLMDDALESIGETDDGLYDWRMLNNGRGWNWDQNKKTNLNGYGNDYRPTPPQPKPAKPNSQRLNSNVYNSYGGSQDGQQTRGMNPVNDSGEIYEDNDYNKKRSRWSSFFCCGC